MSRREVRIAPGGARGPRPTGCGGRMGRTGSFAPTRFVRDVVPQGHLFRCAPLQDAVPYTPCHCEPVRRLARQSVFPARQRRADGTSRTPSPTHSVIASQSAPRSKCPWGTDWRGNPFFQRSPPLDKPVGMGIIIDVRGRCDKRSAPLSVSDLIRLYSLQKPSLVGVAVFVFQLHNTNRNGIPPDVESKYPVHVCHPLSGL